MHLRYLFVSNKKIEKKPFKPKPNYETVEGVKFFDVSIITNPSDLSEVQRPQPIPRIVSVYHAEQAHEAFLNGADAVRIGGVTVLNIQEAQEVFDRIFRIMESA